MAVETSEAEKAERRAAIAQDIATRLQGALSKIMSGDFDEFMQAVAEDDVERALVYFPLRTSEQHLPHLRAVAETLLADDRHSAHHIDLAARAGALFFEAGDLQTAARFASIALARGSAGKDPAVEAAMQCIVGCHRSAQGMHDLALEHFDVVIGRTAELEPEAVAWAHHNRATTLLEMGRNQDAAISYRAASVLRASEKLALEPGKTLCRAADAVHRHNAREALGVYHEALASIEHEAGQEAGRLRGHISAAVASIHFQDLGESEQCLPFLETGIRELALHPEATMQRISAMKMRVFALSDLGREAEARAAQAETDELVSQTPDGFHAELERLLAGPANAPVASNARDMAEAERLKTIELFRKAETLAATDPLAAAAELENAVTRLTSRLHEATRSDIAHPSPLPRNVEKRTAVGPCRAAPLVFNSRRLHPVSLASGHSPDNPG